MPFHIGAFSCLQAIGGQFSSEDTAAVHGDMSGTFVDQWFHIFPDQLGGGVSGHQIDGRIGIISSFIIGPFVDKVLKFLLLQRFRLLQITDAAMNQNVSFVCGCHFLIRRHLPKIIQKFTSFMKAHI